MEKWAFDSKNTILARLLGSNGYFITYNVHLFFSEDVKNHVRKLLRGRKVGVTHEKMGI